MAHLVTHDGFSRHLSLPDSPPSPAPSELSLDASTASSVSSSIVDTAESCCSACCPDSAPQVKPAQPDAEHEPQAVSSSADTPTSVDESAFSPLIIIGAGPHALALAARLSEPRPAALYSDLEHARLSWLQREHRVAPSSGRRQKEKRQAVKGHWAARRLVEPATATLAAPAVDGADRSPERPAIQVLDSSGGDWMARWDAFFKGLRIEHLRSPMLFHPAPADADALVAYARRMSRENELEPIDGVVGAEHSKHRRKKTPNRVGRAAMINERDRDDYHRPSTSLFQSFIQSDLIERYHTAPLVAHTTVASVTYGSLHVAGQPPQDGFVVRSTRPDGTEEVRAAKAVVMAIGPSSAPNVPRVSQDALPARPVTSARAGQDAAP